jgi:hypothetical protein
VGDWGAAKAVGRRNVLRHVRAALIAEVTQWRNNSVTSQAEGDEEMLTFDIPDEALERVLASAMAATFVSRRVSTAVTQGRCLSP